MLHFFIPTGLVGIETISTVQLTVMGSYVRLLQGNVHQKKSLSGKTHVGNQDLYSAPPSPQATPASPERCHSR